MTQDDYSDLDHRGIFDQKHYQPLEFHICAGTEILQKRALFFLENHLISKFYRAHETCRERKDMVLSKPRQTRRKLPLEDKCRLIKEKESGGKSCREVAEVFSFRKSQVSQILRRKA